MTEMLRNSPNDQLFKPSGLLMVTISPLQVPRLQIAFSSRNLTPKLHLVLLIPTNPPNVAPFHSLQLHLVLLIMTSPLNLAFLHSLKLYSILLIMESPPNLAPLH